MWESRFEEICFSPEAFKKLRREQCCQRKEQSVTVSYCQQDPPKKWRLGLSLSGQIPTLPWSHLSLPFSSISVLKEETDTQMSELKALQRAERSCTRSLKPVPLPLACGRQMRCGIAGVAVFSVASWWAVLTFVLLPMPSEVFSCPPAPKSFQMLAQDQQLGPAAKILTSFMYATHNY